MVHNTDWKKEVYARALQEYDDFLKNLENLPFDTLVKHASELALKQHTLDMLKENFPDTLKGLTDVENPLDAVYRESMENTKPYLDYVRKNTEYCSEKILDRQAAEYYKNPDAPLYRKNYSEARPIGEGQMLRNDIQRSKACLEHFSSNISLCYHDGDITGFMQNWIKEFGLERCKTVLAMVVKDATHDERYDKSVKENAVMVSTPNKTYEDLYSGTHPVIINEAYKKLMEMERSKDISKGNKDGKPPKKESRKRTEPER